MKQNHRPKTVEPTEDGQRLRIIWADDHVSEYRPRSIRLACPCAGCVDEFTGKPILHPASIPSDINPVAIDYVGRYALKFTWPDGHDTGMYPWDLLRSLCPCDACATRGAGAGGQPGAGESVGGEAVGGEPEAGRGGE